MLPAVCIEPQAVVARQLRASARVFKPARRHDILREHVPIEEVSRPPGLPAKTALVAREQLKRRDGERGQGLERDWILCKRRPLRCQRQDGSLLYLRPWCNANTSL